MRTRTAINRPPTTQRDLPMPCGEHQEGAGCGGARSLDGMALRRWWCVVVVVVVGGGNHGGDDDNDDHDDDTCLHTDARIFTCTSSCLSIRFVHSAGTSALEMGVNIQGLDVVVMKDCPSDVMSIDQQIGRSGRQVGRPGEHARTHQ
jgi:hypothetical protein